MQAKDKGNKNATNQMGLQSKLEDTHLKVSDNTR